jgi:hypothetical protein
MYNLIAGMTIVFCSFQTVFAKDIKIAQYREDIKPYVRAADVWTQPSWMNSKLQFTSEPDLIKGPKAKGYSKLLVDEGGDGHEVFCRTSKKDQERGFGGKTAKFYCQILEPTGKELVPVVKDNGDRQVIKVKYSPEGSLNNEIYGEILGTRLLWALGFAADQMFYVDRVHCENCSKDPFQQRQVDQGSLVTFNAVAVEKKISGDELLSPIMVSTGNGGSKKIWEAGVKFREMMENLPTTAKERQEQLARRDALRLLAVFMQHTDLKNDNQRFICKEKNKKGQCVKPYMMIQDIGTSFGVRLKNLKLDKVHLQTWRDTPIWSAPAKCKAQLSSNPLFNMNIASEDSSMKNPQISEAGRQFLATLLVNFSSKRDRVRDLFRAAHIDERGRGESVEDWVDAFMIRVQQIQKPTGKNGFKCPKSVYE